MNATKTTLVEVMEFHNTNIAFEEINGKMMINATQMAKPFGKQPIEWLRFQQAKDLIETVCKVRNHSLADLKVVKRGGNNPGTWFQKDVALFFAQWLSPEFYLACNEKLQEVLTKQVLIESQNKLPLFNEIPYLTINGRKLYCYRSLQRLLGYSTKSSVSNVRRKYADHLHMHLNRAYVTEEYALLMQSRAEARNLAMKTLHLNPIILSNQLSLSI